MNPGGSSDRHPDLDAEQTSANSDQHLSTRDQRGSDKDQGLSALDQRLSDMEQDSADRRHRARLDPTVEDREYEDAKRQRDAVTAMRVENAANRGWTRRDRAATSRERDRTLEDRRRDVADEPDSQ